MIHRNFTLFLVAVLVCLTGSIVQAQSVKDGAMAKLTHTLVRLHDEYTTHLAQRSAASFKFGDPLTTLIDDRVLIDAIASGDANVLKDDLVSLGMQNVVAFGRIVSGQLPISAIPAAASLTSLRFAQSAAAMTNAGNVTSQGDQAMRSNVARTTFGVDGSGVIVGALSDSFNCLGGAVADVTSGDLSPVTVVQEKAPCSSGTDEGRAMLQIVHDVAPGASLAFASAFNGMASFATNIQSLAAAGAKVIVDDVVYLGEPFFQDGIVAQAVNSAVSGGVAYFSSAGNQARQSYQSAFRSGTPFAQDGIPSAPGAPRFFGGTAHDFDPGGGTDVFQRITLPNGAGFTLLLQWDSPAFSVSGAPGSPNDIDVYVLNAGASQVLAGSISNNIGSDPIEAVSFTNTTGATADFNIMIVKFSGANPGLLKYVLFNIGVGGTIQEFATNSGTLFGHANAVGAEAVGAARYNQTPAFGVSPPLLETFSSAGTTPILFNLAGSRLATPEIRAKPEIVAPDGVDTTFFGSPDFDGTGFPNFFGTSAAAPHAAAVAALILQTRPILTTGKIYFSLENSAIDIGAAGFDNDSGFGLMQADEALTAALIPTLVDFDSDGKTDVTVYQTNSGNWFVVRTTSGFFTPATNFGGSGFIPVPGDYDGDGKTDAAVYQSSTGNWFIVGSASGFFQVLGFGGSGYIPVPGDYDGDGKTDAAVYQQSTGNWFVVGSSLGFFTPALNFGGSGYLPVPGDRDGDGKTDAAVYQSTTGNWFAVGSSSGFFQVFGFGGNGYMPVPGDYDGDGLTDAAVYQTSTGNWFVVGTSAGFFAPALSFGGSGFVPVFPQVTILRALGIL